MNLAENLEKSAFLFPKHPAVREDTLELTYGQLNQQVNRVATGLIKMGLRPGEPVALSAPNSSDWITTYFGVIKAGGVAVTISGALTGEELANLLRHAKPRFAYSDPRKLGTLESLKAGGFVEKIICEDGDVDLKGLMASGSEAFSAIDRDRSDTVAVLYTGGTTGVPKGVEWTHEGAIFASHAIVYCERSTENDLALCFLPFNHVFGQMHIMNATIMSAGCLELLPSFDMDRVLSLLEAGRVTKFFSVPTVYVRLLGVPDLKKKLGRLRYCFSAAASMAMEIVRQWKERTGITISESYGLTEVMPNTYNHFYPERHVVGSIGQAVPGVEIQIRDTSGNRLPKGQEGEICVRGRNVMKQYLNSPEATRAAFWEGGWLRTGDIGYVDPNGYFYIVDRLKDLIITGGENVYPREVEEALYTRPEVLECAVVGLPDKEWGERVAAFIIPKPGQKIVADDLKGYLKSKLSGFKVPKEYIAVDELPKSPAGKILKREIRKERLEKA
ncbi:MAG: AMP-binding protein [Thermodesulfobacteriota bacterium]